MKKKILTMDDIRPGMYATVYHGKKTYRTVRTPTGEQILSREKDTYKGSVLEIVSIDMPYVVIKYFPKGMAKRGDFTDILDLREVTLMRLEPSYISSLLPDFNFNEDHFWDGVTTDQIKNADEEIHDGFERLSTK